MKFGLVIALLVLLASTNVFCEDTERKDQHDKHDHDGIGAEITNSKLDPNDAKNSLDRKENEEPIDSNEPNANSRRKLNRNVQNSNRKLGNNENHSDDDEILRPQSADREDQRENRRSDDDVSKIKSNDHKRNKGRKGHGESDSELNDRENKRIKGRPDDDDSEHKLGEHRRSKGRKGHGESDSELNDRENKRVKGRPDDDDSEHKLGEHRRSKGRKSDDDEPILKTKEHENKHGKGRKGRKEHGRPDLVSDEHDDKHGKGGSRKGKTGRRPTFQDQEPLIGQPDSNNFGGERLTTDVIGPSANNVHVSGNIVLVKYRSSIVDTVQYDLDGSRLANGAFSSKEPRLSFIRDFIDPESRVTLYVSTSRTTDPKLAFAHYDLDFQLDHFPIPFDINVDLPSQQRGLLERADITLYFFVYVTNVNTQIETFVPAGSSQILLQGTNRLVQKLDIYVRENGIEISGLIRGRFSQRYIQPGTTFQVLIYSEDNLKFDDVESSESVAHLTINNVPAMFPVPFTLLVNHQVLKAQTKYYAIGYMFVNGVRVRLNQEPLSVINEQRSLVSPQLVFTVTPFPFILRGSVTRSMPGSFVLQPNSTLIIRLHQIGSNVRDITFKLHDIFTLPQQFQINMSLAERFDPSKNYDLRALVTDGNNNIYMGSLQPIPLSDEFSSLTIPVDDLLYYVQARLHSSTNKQLTYIPGSRAQIFVTESPETPTKPIVAMRIDSIPYDFREFSIQVPATAIQRSRNYYLVMMIEINGFITHVSKTLLLSNNQQPPLVLQLPVLSLDLFNGVIFDVESRPAQWSSSSYATLYLIDDKIDDPEQSIVQTWKIHLENDFPIRFEVQVDFSRLRADRVYRLQSSIENARNLLEYKPAGSVLALNPQGGIMRDVRIPVRNIKSTQAVKGLIYIQDMRKELPEKSEIIVQLSSTPSLDNPSVIDEIRLNAEGERLPLNFTMNIPLNKVDINSVYYFLVRYVVHGNVVIPASQAFAFSPRNDAVVVLTLSKTPQIPITGQVTSTGSPLTLPIGSTLHLYITDNYNVDDPTIYSEVYLKATPNSIYQFTMNIDSLILQKKIPLYLRADILYDDEIVLSIPRPALLQITPGGEWNINLVVDLPTLIIGQIMSMNRDEDALGDFDVHLELFERGKTVVVHTSHLRLGTKLPQRFRIEIDNEFFARFTDLQVRAVVRDCKGQTLFESGGSVGIHPGLNVRVDLPVVLTDREKLSEIKMISNEVASLYAGVWRLSVTGVATDVKVDGFERSQKKRISDN